MKLHPTETTWQTVLANEYKKPYYQTLIKKVSHAYQMTTVFPPKNDVFAALNLCPYTSTKVVILGQDPYHGAGQAHGLCFSVPDGQPHPPSLKNIFKEIEYDTGTLSPQSGNLTHWTRQGVLLLNSTLTVTANKPASHFGWGWEQFTDSIISSLDQSPQPIAFLLWGTAAQSKTKLITNPKHLILCAPHPSPLSAYRGWFSCRHFSQTNEWLKGNGELPIIW